MAEHKQEAHAVTEPKGGWQIHRIAGPETAKLLGVPIGTVVETRDLEIVHASDEREGA